MFIGLVAVATFLIVSSLLGWLGKAAGIVADDNDSSNLGVGCGLWIIIIVLAFICLIIGHFITMLHI